MRKNWGWATHVQRQCPCCSVRGFQFWPVALCYVSSPLLPFHAQTLSYRIKPESRKTKTKKQRLSAALESERPVQFLMDFTERTVS